MMRSIVFGILAFVNFGAMAQERIAVYGRSSGQCTDYLEKRTASDRSADLQVMYVWGFVSGHNAYAPTRQVTEELPAGSVHDYLERYCRANPFHATSNAAMSLIRELTAPGVPLKQ